MKYLAPYRTFNNKLHILTGIFSLESGAHWQAKRNNAPNAVIIYGTDQHNATGYGVYSDLEEGVNASTPS